MDIREELRGNGALCGRFSMKTVLGWLCASRVGIVLAFLMLPKSMFTIYANE